MICQVCRQRQVYPGSNWCGTTCRDSGRPGSINYQQMVQVQQGVPFCRMCNRPAFYDGMRRCYAPGCTITHTQEAKSRGFFNPR
jgi:hypothetical protein